MQLSAQAVKITTAQWTEAALGIECKRKRQMLLAWRAGGSLDLRVIVLPSLIVVRLRVNDINRHLIRETDLVETGILPFLKPIPDAEKPPADSHSGGNQSLELLPVWPGKSSDLSARGLREYRMLATQRSSKTVLYG